MPETSKTEIMVWKPVEKSTFITSAMYKGWKIYHLTELNNSYLATKKDRVIANTDLSEVIKGVNVYNYNESLKESK